MDTLSTTDPNVWKSEEAISHPLQTPPVSVLVILLLFGLNTSSKYSSTHPQA